MSNAEKLLAFRNYDFDGNQSWKLYRSNLELPPGASEAEVLKRYKAKWYQREMDKDFDPAWVNTGGGSGSPSATSTQEPSVPKPAASPSGAAPPSSTGPAPQQEPSTGTPNVQQRLAGLAQSLNPQALMFGLHLALLLLFVLLVQPLLPAVSRGAYTWFLRLGLLGHGYKVYQQCGAPTLWPLASLKAWVQRAAPITDFHYAMLMILFATNRPISLLCVPVATLALYHSDAFAATRFKDNPLWRRYGARLHSWLASKQAEAQLLNAGAEIGVGFLVVLQLLTRHRNLLLPLVYWNMLKARYWAPDSAVNHRRVWGIVDQATRPVLQRLTFLQGPIGFVQRWFSNVGGRA